MEGSGNPFLHFYAGIALLLFLVSFVMILIRTLTRTSSEMNHCSNLPLEDEAVQPELNNNPDQSKSSAS